MTSYYDGSAFLVDAVADRFEVLMRRYHMFCKDIPSRFHQWLKTAPAQKRVFASLESVCMEMFPEHMSVDVSHEWIVPVACTALKHWALQSGIELSACGRAIRVGDSPPCETPLVSVDSLKESLFSATCAASRTAALEIQVAQLECKLKGLLLRDLEQTFAFLSESRVEALDALAALRKAQSAMKRETAQLNAANLEITRLKEEIDDLKSQKEAARCQDEDHELILPKSALSLAGYWNLQPNELLKVTPALIQSVEERGGGIVRREGMHVCFLSKDRDILQAAAEEVMGAILPDFARKRSF